MKTDRHIHFVGIGGIGMSGIAEVLITLGCRVSGSDLSETEITKRLRMLGAKVYKGHKASHIGSADLVVVSSAVSKQNPEVKRARRLKIPVVPRAAMLSELMQVKKGIALSGTHGKTTTTSMVGTLLASAKLDPTVVIGGRLNRWGTNAKLGQGAYLVAEADESDGSFQLLSPMISVVTNIDNDHLDYYKNLGNIKKAFVRFLERLPFYGLAVLCLDDPGVKSILRQVSKRVLTYGVSSQADYQARNIVFRGRKTIFTVYKKNKKMGVFKLQVPGLHNVRNALAAIIVGEEIGLRVAQIQRGLLAYTGVQRRFQIRGEIFGITVMDDYGHHPTEIKVVLEACKKVWPRRRLVVAFQPHRYSRTRDLFKSFLTAFKKADVLLLADIYSAGEKPISGVSGKKLFRALTKKHKWVYFSPHRQLISHDLERLIRRGDVVLTLGAGDIWKSGEELLEKLKKHGFH